MCIIVKDGSACVTGAVLIILMTWKRESDMKITKILTFIIVSTMLCGALSSCSSDKVKTSKNTAADVKKSSLADGELPTAADLAGVELEDAVTAKSGDAYLAIADEDYKMQYWGGSDENNQLTYDAGVVHIDKNGDYTVSVNADTKGLRYRATGNPDTEYKPKGLGFLAVVINDGEKAVPDAIITVKSVKVDGKDVELKKKNYTNTESGEVRSNIFNAWVGDSFPADARSAEGALFNDFNTASPAEINDGSYSAEVIGTEAFAEWTKVEVTFTVSGLAS